MKQPGGYWLCRERVRTSMQGPVIRYACSIVTLALLRALVLKALGKTELLGVFFVAMHRFRQGFTR